MNNEDITTDKDSDYDNNSPDAELASEHGVVNTGSINENNDIPEDNINVDDMELDARPETYHDCLLAT